MVCNDESTKYSCNTNSQTLFINACIILQDTENGFFMNVNKQINEVCAKIQADPLLANGYHAVGFSQGGQFL